MNLIETSENAIEKIKICKSCEHYNSTLKQCKVCLCIVPLKAWIPGNNCPLKKWDLSTDPE